MIETTRPQRKLLKKIIKLSKKKKYASYKDLNVDSDNPDISHMLNVKLIKLTDSNLITKKNTSLYIHYDSVVPLDAGLIYFDFRKEEFWHFIKRSILVPIAVSIFTTGALWLCGSAIGIIKSIHWL